MIWTLAVIVAVATGLWLAFPLTRRVALVGLVLVRRFTPCILGKLRLIQYPVARATRLAFEDLGPAYVKFGQMIASSPTAFPPDVVQEFSCCFDEVRQLHPQKIQKLIEKSIGTERKEEIEVIDSEPLASASIAQVHTATLKNGESVVIKVQRPGIEKRVVQDLRMMTILAKSAQRMFRELRRANLTGIVEDLKRTMAEEIDFEKEAQNISDFREMLLETKLTDIATAPRVHRHLSTKQVIVMDRLLGVRIDDKEGVEKREPQVRKVLRGNSQVFWTSVFLGGFFHGDIHAGNILVLDDGRLGYLDFGIFGRFTMEDRIALADWLAGMITSDGEKLALAMKRMRAVPDSVDWDVFVKDAADTFLPLRSATLEDTELIESFYPRLRALALKHDMSLPQNFVLILKQITYFGRYVMIHDPTFNENIDPEAQKNLLMLFQRFNALRESNAAKTS